MTDLEYYIGRRPTSEEITDAEDWLLDHPGSNLSEWVDAMEEIGAL